MSKTIRRKNERWKEYWFVDAWYNYYTESVDNAKERAQRLAAYHSDKYEFHAPKDYRQACNREFRAKNKAILDKAIRTDNDPIFIPFIKDVDWNYF